MVVRSLSITLWKSADPRLRVFVAFSSATQATTAIQTGRVRMQDRMLTISRLTPTDSSVLIRQQSAQMQQLPLPTPFSEPGLATPGHDGLNIPVQSVRSEIRSLNEEMEKLQKRLQDAYGKCKEFEQYQKERDKQWHTRCISSREEWEQECLSLRTELKEATSQQDEAMRRLQKCQNELAAVREAHGKELVKRAEQEREIQVLRSREAVEPELLKAFLAIEALTDKGTVKLEPPQPHTPRKKKKEE